MKASFSAMSKTPICRVKDVKERHAKPRRDMHVKERHAKPRAGRDNPDSLLDP